jgi:ankyrin repeat protein
MDEGRLTNWVRRITFVAILAAVVSTVAVTTASAQADLRLVSALKNQQSTAARALIRQRVDVNAPDVDGSTPLQWAAHWNDLEMVKALLAAGAKPTVANRYGVTPLHEAATIGSASVVSALLRAGAKPDATYGEGETPLMLAARSGNVDSVKLLLEANADVNAAEKFRGQTALMLAATENHAAVVKALARRRRTAQHALGRIHVPETDRRRGRNHPRSSSGWNHRVDAGRAQGALEAGTALVAGGADLTLEEPQYGFTAMQTAIFNGHYAFAKMLIERAHRSTTARCTSSSRCATSRSTRTGRTRPSPRTASASRRREAARRERR